MSVEVVPTPGRIDIKMAVLDGIIELGYD